MIEVQFVPLRDSIKKREALLTTSYKIQYNEEFIRWDKTFLEGTKNSVNIENIVKSNLIRDTLTLETSNNIITFRPETIPEREKVNEVYEYIKAWKDTGGSKTFRVISCLVKEGQQVKKGDRLFDIFYIFSGKKRVIYAKSTGKVHLLHKTYNHNFRIGDSLVEIIQRNSHQSILSKTNTINQSEKRQENSIETGNNKESKTLDKFEQVRSSPENILAELDALIGLSSVKLEVKQLISLAKIEHERSQIGLKNQSINRHIVFQGPPGTGKTTVARLIGKIYKSLGVLSKGHFIEADRSKLIAGHIGQTAIKTLQVLDSAKGGVLFIDEAYSLAKIYHDGSNDPFAEESIETIIKYMEDNREDIAVIVAGYQDQMAKFLNTNPGLKSRFNTFLTFPNYSENELLEILVKVAKENSFELGNGTENVLANIIKQSLEVQKQNFGNARSMRNLVEVARKKQALRLMMKKSRTEKDLKILSKEDFTLTSSEINSL